jgi:hypothetical protein
MSDQPDLYERLSKLAYDQGPVLLDYCKCQHCGDVELIAIPMSRGFEHLPCGSCGESALDQMNIPV